MSRVIKPSPYQRARDLLARLGYRPVAIHNLGDGGDLLQFTGPRSTILLLRDIAGRVQVFRPLDPSRSHDLDASLEALTRFATGE